MAYGGRVNVGEEAWELHRYGLLAPPDCRLPKHWAISAGGLAVPPLPDTAEHMRRFIARRRSWMTPTERRLPENDDGQANWGRWMERFEREREAVIATNDGPRSRETRYNTGGRKDWWGATGHTVASAIEAARRHVATGSAIPFRLLPPVPRFPPPRPVPRQVVKEERRSPPRRGGGITIRERRQRSPPRPRGRLFLRRPRAEAMPVETIPYGYDVPSKMRNEHDGDSPGLLARSPSRWSKSSTTRRASWRPWR